MNKNDIIPSIESDKTVIVGQNEAHFQELKWQIKPHKGHTIWEVNLETGDIKAAEFQRTDVQINSMEKVNMHLQAIVIGKAIPATEVKKRLITKAGHGYISALNIQSAAKQLATRHSRKWWEDLPYEEREHLCKIFFPAKKVGTMDNRDIEKLWRLELKQQ